MCYCCKCINKTHTTSFSPDRCEQFTRYFTTWYNIVWGLPGKRRTHVYSFKSATCCTEPLVGGARSYIRGNRRVVTVIRAYVGAEIPLCPEKVESTGVWMNYLTVGWRGKFVELLSRQDFTADTQWVGAVSQQMSSVGKSTGEPS